MATTPSSYFSRMVDGLETKFSESDLWLLFKAMVEKEDEPLRALLSGKHHDYITDMAVLASRLAGRQYRAWFRLHKKFEDPDAKRTTDSEHTPT